MEKELLYDNLLNTIKEEFPQKTNLVSALVDLLLRKKLCIDVCGGKLHLHLLKLLL